MFVNQLFEELPEEARRRWDLIRQIVKPESAKEKT